MSRLTKNMSKGMSKGKTGSSQSIKKSKSLKKDSNKSAQLEEIKKLTDPFIDTLSFNLLEIGGELPDIFINNEAAHTEGNKKFPLLFLYYKPGTTTIQEIKFKCNIISNKLLQALHSSISSLGSITDLRIEYCKLTEDHMYLINSILQSNEQITNLSLDGNPNHSQNFSIILTGSHLKTLSLRQCKIDKLGLDLLGEKLDGEKQTLISLNLAGNLIDDGAIDVLANLLRSNRTLVALNICDNCITETGFLCFFRVFRSFPLKHNEIILRRHNIFEMLSKETELVYVDITDSKESIICNSMNVKKKSERQINSETSSVRNSSRRIFKSTHPFVLESTIEDGEIICNGNNALLHLNISYNGITPRVLETIIDMISYQKSKWCELENTNVGLQKVIVGEEVFYKYPELVEEMTNLLSNISKKGSSYFSNSFRSVKRPTTADL